MTNRPAHAATPLLEFAEAKTFSGFNQIELSVDERAEEELETSGQPEDDTGIHSTFSPSAGATTTEPKLMPSRPGQVGPSTKPELGPGSGLGAGKEPEEGPESGPERPGPGRPGPGTGQTVEGPGKTGLPKSSGPSTKPERPATPTRGPSGAANGSGTRLSSEGIPSGSNTRASRMTCLHEHSLNINISRNYGVWATVVSFFKTFDD